MTVYDKLLSLRKEKGAGHLVLLDPDHDRPGKLAEMAARCESLGADGFLIGGSLLLSDHFDDMVKAVKEAVSGLVILFPGSGRQLSRHADALLFMSLISGRNPNFLIGEQVMAAPQVRAYGLEAIGMGYMLVESGRTTSVEFISNTRPLPRNKPDIAAAHALAAEYLGMKLLYLEAGSGAECPVPELLVKVVSRSVSIPVMVGGGIRSGEEAASRVRAGASFIVTGNALEKDPKSCLVQEIASAVHQAGRGLHD